MFLMFRLRIGFKAAAHDRFQTGRYQPAQERADHGLRIGINLPE